MTPLRHLPICRALKVFSFRNLDRSSIADGSIEKVPGPSIASRQLVDRLSFSSCVFTLFLDTFLTTVFVNVVFLDTFLDRWLDTSIYQELLRIYIFVLRDPILISSISLDLFAPVHLPNTLSFTSNLFLKNFFEINQAFLHLVSFDSLIFMHFILWNLSLWDFCKIWDFSKSKRFLCNFWDGFWRFNLKNSMHCFPCAL